MKKEFIPYELALELKKLGFDEICLGYYFIGNTFSISMNNTMFTKNSIVNNRPDNVITAPLWQQAFDWFREKYDIFSKINRNYIDKSLKEYWYEIEYFHNNSLHGTSSIADSKYNLTYEEARLECLKKLIELCKQI